MRRHLWPSTVLAVIAGLSLIIAIPSAGARTGRAHKPALKLGRYFVKTSPALESSGNTGQRVPFAMEFTLAQTAGRNCGGPRTAKSKVFCLTANGIGAYGTYSTTGVATNCTDAMGDPEPAGEWNPVIRVPANGRVSVNQTIRTDRGEPSTLIKASLNISKTGVFTGTYVQTLYVSTGGAPFLGCTTGPLTLKGKLES